MKHTNLDNCSINKSINVLTNNQIQDLENIY